jgi:predicted transcriptional regulator
MIAKELMIRYNLKQAEAAKLMGVSQPAISLYYRRIRGKAIDLGGDVEVKKLMENLADSLAGGGLSHKDFISKFCEICKIIRAKRLLCKLHKTFDPSIDVEKCELCRATDSLRCT